MFEVIFKISLILLCIAILAEVNSGANYLREIYKILKNKGDL